MTPERFEEIKQQDRGPFLPAVKELIEEVENLREGLVLILNQAHGKCEHVTGDSIDECFRWGDRFVNAKYADNLACPACIAHRALLGLEQNYVISEAGRLSSDLR